MHKLSSHVSLGRSGRAMALLGLGVLLGTPVLLAQTADACASATDQRPAGTGAGDVARARTDIASLLSSTVIFLFAEDGSTPLGTAFIVGYPVPDKPGQVVPLVVTAKHVVAGRSTVLGRFTGKPGVPPVTERYDLAALRKLGDLWEHPDEGVDILVFRTLSPAQTEYEPLPLDLIASQESFVQEDVKAADRVIFPSLLVNFMGAGRNYPVIRDGAIALIPDEPVPVRYLSGNRLLTTTQPLILVDAMVSAGASGSPVFLWPGPRLKSGGLSIGGTRPLLLGIVHGYFNAWPQVLVELGPNVQIPASMGNSGIAIVFPSWRLLEILRRDDVRKRILELIAKGE